jgi:hypothetical protein
MVTLVAGDIAVLTHPSILALGALVVLIAKLGAVLTAQDWRDQEST